MIFEPKKPLILQDWKIYLSKLISLNKYFTFASLTTCLKSMIIFQLDHTSCLLVIYDWYKLFWLVVRIICEMYVSKEKKRENIDNTSLKEYGEWESFTLFKLFN